MSAQLTKRALEDALKRQLRSKSLARITISDLTDDCGVSRMTFYYHFQDIYDLVEWSCHNDAALAMAGNRTAQTWQRGLLSIFESLRMDRDFIMSVYRCMSRARIEAFLNPIVHDLIVDVMLEKEHVEGVSSQDRDFVASFFEYAIIGCLLAWIDGGMAEEPSGIVDRIATIMDGQTTLALERFSGSRSLKSISPHA